MSDGANARNSTNPAELWKQWSDTSSKMWSNILDGDKASFMDPIALYQAWVKNVGAAQEQFKASLQGMMDPREAGKQWLDAMTESWRKIAEMGGDPLGLTGQWLEMMENARARMLEEGSFPADPFTFFKQWYDATSETWSKVVGDVIGTEQFIEYASHFLESYASFAATFRRANEEYFRNLQLPTRSDLARVAELVVTLEEKVDRIDDAFEDFEESHARTATASSVAALEKRLDRLEDKLDKVLAALEKANVKARTEPASATRRKAQKKNAQEVKGTTSE